MDLLLVFVFSGCNVLRLFIDDLREPPTPSVEDDFATFFVARSTNQAIEIINEFGWPEFMSLDHDLGGDDTAMVFLKRLVNEIWTDQPIPKYFVHSANPVGSDNIHSFMQSWKKSLSL